MTATTGHRGAVPEGYSLVSRLAVGGMAELFLVQPSDGGKPVVLKRLLPNASPEVGKLFVREAEALAALSSPHIVGFVAAGPGYLLVEHVDGCDLATVLQYLGRRGQRLEAVAALALVDDILAGAEVLHAAGLIHRDLNPRNVMVGRDGRARIIDLGIVKRPTLQESTVDGLKGTLAYMAPEQLAGDAVSDATDLYAIGLMAYELLAGVSLAPPRASIAELTSLRTQVPHAPSSFGALPVHDDTLLKALDPEPGKRWGSAVGFRGALGATETGVAARRGIVEVVAAAARTQRPPEPIGTHLAPATGADHTVSSPGSRSRVLVAALVAGLVLGGVMLGWLVGRSGNESGGVANPGWRDGPRNGGPFGRRARRTGRVKVHVASLDGKAWTVVARGNKRTTPFSLDRLRQGVSVVRVLGDDGKPRGAVRLRMNGRKLVVIGRRGVSCGSPRMPLPKGASVECRVGEEGGLRLSRR